MFKEEGHRASSVFEADRPMTAGPDTRVTRDQFSWANPWSSRFARAYDYAADLRHIARYLPSPRSAVPWPYHVKPMETILPTIGPVMTAWQL